MSQSYIVQWEIDISADNPEDAAREALEIMRDPHSEALFFKIIDNSGHLTDIDLLEV